MQDFSLISYTLIACVAILLVRLYQSSNSQLNAIPTVGSSGILSSYIAGVKFIFGAGKVVQEGFDRYRGGIFKVSTLTHWLVVVNGPELIDELRKAPDDRLSGIEANNQILQMKYTLGLANSHNFYLQHIIRSSFTRNLGNQFPYLYDELVAAFADNIMIKGNEWTTVQPYHAFMQIIIRGGNRAFVGLPLARNSEYIDLNHQHTIDVAKAAAIINQFPTFLQPLVAAVCTRLRPNIRKGVKHMKPIIEERRRAAAETKDEPKDLANVDILSWLMEGSLGKELTIEELTILILTVNFASVHTSSMTFIHALFDLAANQQYVQPLREEVESIIEKEGWSKESIGKLRKLDSFLRESQRFNGLGCINLVRRTLKPFTFSNGTVIPTGTMVCAAATPTHRDEMHYSNPNEFDGFRFVNDEGDAGKLSMVTTGVDFIPFGHGRHACPGRFLVAVMLKTMFAHILLHYDFKFAEDGPRPPNFAIDTSIIPNTKAQVMFRKRSTV